MNQIDFSDLADLMSQRYRFPLRNVGPAVLDSRDEMVLLCSAASTYYDNTKTAQFIAAAANLAVIGEKEGA